MKPANEPNLMRHYLWHCAIGFGLSAVFVAGVLWFDIARLGTLIAGSDIGWLAVFLLWFFNGTVFGSVQFAVHLMLNTDKDDDDHRGQMITVRVAAPK